MIKINFTAEVEARQTADFLTQLWHDPMGGWMRLPRAYNFTELARIKEASTKIREESEVLVCIGIGGSYLGHRAVIEALRPKSNIKIVYAGNSLSERELLQALAEVGDADFSINVISKSGTTLEPKLAFDAFKNKLIEKYGEASAYDRIYATTDANTGALHDEAVANHYAQFVVPDNIGGRYSVLTAVGMLPMCVAGIDVDRLLAGASEMAIDLDSTDPATLLSHPSIEYAWMRHTLARKSYDTEVFASFEPCLSFFTEWLKQLFGESEGKHQRGVWPASVIYSTDLHSLGQFMQDGRRNLWETILDVPTDELNRKAVTAVTRAHLAGGIPVLSISAPSLDEFGLGQLIYFFELACALSARLMGVNPFDQPGVEAYKSELRALMAN